MAQFLLILYDSPRDWVTLSPEEMQKIIEKYKAWTQKLAQAGRLVGSHKLKDEGGRILSSRNGQMTVTDGPYSEAKEVIGGYYLIEARDYPEAVETSKSCPHLAYGGKIELREIDPV